MTNFAKFKIMTIDELADFLDKFGQFDGTPWSEWFGHHYCDNCESIRCKHAETEEKLGILPPSYRGEVDCAYCELNDQCKFFPQIEGIPENREVIKMWLNKEVDYDERPNDSKSAN